MIKIKKYLMLILLSVLLSLCFTACNSNNNEKILSAPEAKTNETPSKSEEENKQKSQLVASELNFLNWENYIPEKVLEDFMSKTNIKINLFNFSSEAELYEKLQNEPNKYDLIVISDSFISKMIKNDMLEKINTENIKNFDILDKKYLNRPCDPQNFYSMPYVSGSICLMYNKSLVNFPVKSYNDLWNPALKNSLMLVDDERSILGIVLKSLGYSLNEEDPKKISQAVYKFEKLIPNIKVIDASEGAEERLVNREVKAGLFWSSGAALAEMKSSDCIYVEPIEGLCIWQDNFCIPKNAPHKREAEAFIDFCYEPQNSLEIYNLLPYAIPNTKAQEQLDPNILANPIIYPTKNILSKSEICTYSESLDEAASEMWEKVQDKIKQ